VPDSSSDQPLIPNFVASGPTVYVSLNEIYRASAVNPQAPRRPEKFMKAARSRFFGEKKLVSLSIGGGSTPSMAVVPLMPASHRYGVSAKCQSESAPADLAAASDGAAGRHRALAVMVRRYFRMRIDRLRVGRAHHPAKPHARSMARQRLQG